MPRTTTALLRLLPLLALAAVLGCGSGQPPTYPVEGTLVYADGTPVPGRAAVTFHTEIDGKTYEARGAAEPNGNFKLTTFAADDGAVAGEHRVTVLSIPGGELDKPTVATKYGSLEKSEIKATVAPQGGNKVTIQVERNDKAKK